MPSHEFQVNRYQVILIGDRAVVRGGWQAYLRLVGDKDDSEARVFFVPATSTAPPNRIRADGAVEIFLPLDRYESWLDLLRNEEPVFFVVNTSFLGNASLRTAEELVGEGELTCCPLPCEPATPPPGDDVSETSGDWELFDPDARSYNLLNSYLLALASYHVYGDERGELAFADYFEQRLEPWIAAGSADSPVFRFFDTGDQLPGSGLQAFIMSNSRFVVVVFRGTQVNPVDWPTNILGINALPVDVTRPWLGAAHGGWVAQVADQYGNLVQEMNAQSNGFEKPVWITGHSLGGALASVLAQRFHDAAATPVQGVVTFGTPRLADPVFYGAYGASGLADRTQRWVNNEDAGPAFPIPIPGPLPALYLHPTLRMNFIDGNGQIMRDKLDTPVPSPHPINALDHVMASYCRLLYDALSDSEKAAVPSPP